jgi:hypothetical protein
MLQCADVDDEAPHGNGLTAYDQEHLVIYLSLLDAETDGKDWREVARDVLLENSPRAGQVDDRGRLSTAFTG